MNLDYNIYFEVSAAFFMLFQTMYIILQYDMKVHRNLIFCIMSVFVLVANILDVITAVYISNPGMISITANKLGNTAYFITDGILSYMFLIYALEFGTRIGKRDKASKSEKLLIIAYMIVLVTNWNTHIIFYFDDAGRYIHGNCYILVYIMPYFFFIKAAFMMLRNFKLFTLKQKISIILYIVVSMSGAFIQVFIWPHILLSLFTIALAVCIMLFSIETPEFNKLNETMLELSEARNRAQIANDSKSRFLANMSHEIRTPINAIVGMNELIIRESKESDVVDYANNVQLACNSLLSIINDILDISKIESGKMEIISSKYDIGALIDDTCKMMLGRAESKNLELSIICESSVPKYLIGDETRIRQILVNLLTNAIKYTKEGSIVVRIKWKNDSDDENTIHLLMSVEDTGIGIAKENQDKLFTSYERFDEERNKGIEGTGLGLAITKQLVELMNGEIGVYSELGKGSLFYVEIPQQRFGEEVVGNLLKEINTKERGRNEYNSLFKAPDAKILVVDDVKANLIVMKGLLKETGVRVDLALSGKECLEMCDKLKYDLILLDHLMPEMDGIETFKKLRNAENKLNLDTPVIALTANAVSGAREEYLKIGFDDYLSKPVIGIDLEEMVEKYLPIDKVVK